jgi:hypothetical protein
MSVPLRPELDLDLVQRCYGCYGGGRQISDGIMSLGIEAIVAVVWAAGGCISMTAEGLHQPIHRQQCGWCVRRGGGTQNKAARDKIVAGVILGKLQCSYK